jgi:hypothetical protein
MKKVMHNIDKQYIRSVISHKNTSVRGVFHSMDLSRQVFMMFTAYLTLSILDKTTVLYQLIKVTCQQHIN